MEAKGEKYTKALVQTPREKNTLLQEKKKNWIWFKHGSWSLQHSNLIVIAYFAIEFSVVIGCYLKTSLQEVESLLLLLTNYIYWYTNKWCKCQSTSLKIQYFLHFNHAFSVIVFNYFASFLRFHYVFSMIVFN